MFSLHRISRAAYAATVCVSVVSAASAEDPYNVGWSRQLGTSASDYGRSVAVDTIGNAYISGYTLGSLEGQNAGSADAFLTKYEGSGNLLWKRQLGTSATDTSWSMAVDASGNAYISGYTYGSLGGTNAGDRDAFLTKYNGSGNLLWSRQIGTSAYDESSSMAVDTYGNAYISGVTYGASTGRTRGTAMLSLPSTTAQALCFGLGSLARRASDKSYSVGRRPLRQRLH